MDKEIFHEFFTNEEESIMQSFTYLSPTEVVFGKDTQNQTAEYIRKYGGSRILLVYGGGSVVRSGLLKQIRRRNAQSYP